MSGARPPRRARGKTAINPRANASAGCEIFDDPNVRGPSRRASVRSCDTSRSSVTCCKLSRF